MIIRKPGLYIYWIWGWILKTLPLIILMISVLMIEPVRADLIDKGNFTTDDITGLDWLDMGFTVDKSYNDVTYLMTTNTFYQGWRYATGSEFNELISNYDGSSPPHTGDYSGGKEEYNGVVDLFIDLLGRTTDTPHYWSTVGILDISYVGHQYAAKLADGDYNQFLTRDFIYTRWKGIPTDEHSPTVGSFLVRRSHPPVPEPSTYLLFAFGLIGMVWYRKKQGLKS